MWSSHVVVSVVLGVALMRVVGSLVILRSNYSVQLFLLVVLGRLLVLLVVLVHK